MTPAKRQPALDSPTSPTSRTERRFGLFRRGDGGGNERFGRWTEGIARGMGTPWFLLGLTVFALAWLAWNTMSPEPWRFDSAALGFTALTLILSLQASYAAPMILLAQNRQDDRDRVQIEQDRQRAERALADTEFLAREVVALRIALRDLPDRDFVRAELRALLADLELEREIDRQEQAAERPAHAEQDAEIAAGFREHTHDISAKNDAEDASETEPGTGIDDRLR
ncbi:DUF1003 domain-containing protein [Leucobacter sp. Z1108]|uniref:DUF1003 domain-containing protein n=1 Tax=Leucobacter sp. Z1108 TaxID=3439066 RepID=UPI003F358D00